MKITKKKGVMLVLGILALLVFALFASLSLGKPQVGDCVNVKVYGEIETDRYCTISGDIQRGSGSTYSFDLAPGCQFYVCEFCTEGCKEDLSDCVNGRWTSLDAANSNDGILVDKSYCGE